MSTTALASVARVRLDGATVRVRPRRSLTVSPWASIASMVLARPMSVTSADAASQPPR